MDITFYEKDTRYMDITFYEKDTGEINESGEKWLETDGGIDFLTYHTNRLKDRGESWLITEEAIYWLAFKNSGKKWLKTEDGKEYLEYLGSRQYLGSLKKIIENNNSKISLRDIMKLKIKISEILDERYNNIEKAIEYQKDYKEEEERKYQERKEKERQKLEEEEIIKENQQKDYYFFNEIDIYERETKNVFDNTDPNNLPYSLRKLRKEYLERHENDPKEKEITWGEFGRNMFDSGTEVLKKCFGKKCKKNGGKQNTNKNRKNKSKKIRKRHMKSRRNKKANM